jgi:pimeloyl-ACP methyl ester carboxylesterase
VIRHAQVDVGGGIELHVAELGRGKPVLFCHGFPDTWLGWRRQMEAVAAAGYRAIAPDMRGYGGSSAPADPHAYTTLHTTGDLVGLLDALGLATATIVGHDFGAAAAWGAAMMRPDRFTGVFGVSVAFAPRGDQHFLQALDAAGKRDSFYMFDEMKADAAARWSDAAVTFPAFLYWSSGSPPPTERWDPFDTARERTRPAPVAVPDWADPADVAAQVADFRRTGFQGGLNYYRSLLPGFALTAAFKGAVIRQPSFFVYGKADGLNLLREPDELGLRQALPDLRGFVAMPEVGHWPNRERSDDFNRLLLGFLEGLD